MTELKKSQAKHPAPHRAADRIKAVKRPATPSKAPSKTGTKSTARAPKKPIKTPMPKVPTKTRPVIRRLKKKRQLHPAIAVLLRVLKNAWHFVKHFLPYPPSSRLGRQILLGLIAFVLLVVGSMYGIARWYIYSVSDQPQVVGASFIPDYAQSLGLNPQQTLYAMLHDLHIKQLRLTSYWSDMETAPGVYDFSQLDWEFAMAEQAGAKVTLSVGLRQPRWPECHAPSWVDTSKPTSDWQPQLEDFMTAIVKRYQSSSALESYQVENEYFLQGFGECQNFDRDRLVSEFNLVRKLDPVHPIIINRSNNGIGLPLAAPTPDEYGVSIYKRVWDNTWTHRYLEYPQPAWYYAFMAGMQKLVQGREMIAHEVQAEAWPPNSQSITQTSLAEQNKSLDAKRLADRFEYGRATGLRTVDMWGAEYWYYRKVVLHDDSLWRVAKQEYAKS
jgi:hypothetical protein